LQTQVITNLGCQWAIAIAGKDPEFVIHRANSYGEDATWLLRGCGDRERDARYESITNRRTKLLLKAGVDRQLFAELRHRRTDYPDTKRDARGQGVGGHSLRSLRRRTSATRVLRMARAADLTMRQTPRATLACTETWTRPARNVSPPIHCRCVSRRGPLCDQHPLNALPAGALIDSNDVLGLCPKKWCRRLLSSISVLPIGSLPAVRPAPAPPAT